MSDDAYPRSMTPEIRQWCQDQIEAYIKENEWYHDCPDNFRYAEIGNEEQLAWYEDVRKTGCCGEEEFQREGPDGKTYMLGFNHGH